MHSFGIIGAGAWGTALATVIRRAGHDVTIRAHEQSVVQSINSKHLNDGFLPGILLDPKIYATQSYEEAINNDIILLATPAQFIRPTLTSISPKLATNTPLVICSKGIEQTTGKLLSEVVSEVSPYSVTAVLSGPTFADEVAKGLPTAITLACEDINKAENLASIIGTTAFRPYTSSDLLGAQIGGAVKNVIAIACGIVDGRGLGQNARASIIARGLAEIGRFGEALNVNPQTLMGLSGLGDLTLTCTSEASRNYSVGKKLGEGTTPKEIMNNRRSIAEGVHTAPAVITRATSLGVEMPICNAVKTILHDNGDLDITISNILARPFRLETQIQQCRNL